MIGFSTQRVWDRSEIAAGNVQVVDDVGAAIRCRQYLNRHEIGVTREGVGVCKRTSDAIADDHLTREDQGKGVGGREHRQQHVVLPPFHIGADRHAVGRDGTVDERDLNGEERAAGGDIDLAVTVREQSAGETHEDWPFGIANAIGVHPRARHGIRRSLDPERTRAVERIRCHLEDGICPAIKLDLVAEGRTGRIQIRLFKRRIVLEICVEERRAADKDSKASRKCKGKWAHRTILSVRRV